jgi:hypothetical protein
MVVSVLLVGGQVWTWWFEGNTDYRSRTTAGVSSAEMRARQVAKSFDAIGAVEVM